MCEKQAICPLCGKPVGPYPKDCEEAKIYHMACLMKSTKHLREKK